MFWIKLLLGVGISSPIFMPSIVFASPQEIVAQKTTNNDHEVEKLLAEAFALYQELRPENAADVIAKFQQVLSLLPASADNNKDRAYILYFIGNSYRVLGNKTQAIANYEQAVELEDKIAEPPTKALLFRNLSQLYGQQNTVESRNKAIALNQKFLAINRALPAEKRELVFEYSALKDIAQNYAALKQLPQAINYHTEALTLTRTVDGLKPIQASALFDLGLAHNSLGKPPSFKKAIALWQEALPLRRAENNREQEALLLLVIGKAYQNLQQSQEAISYYQQALPLNQEMGDRLGEATLLNNLGSIYQDLGETHKAIALYEEVNIIAQEIEQGELTATNFNNLGLIYKNLGELTIAIKYYQQALATSREIDNKSLEAKTLNNLGEARNFSGDKQQALNTLEKSLSLHQEIGDRLEVAIVLNNLAKVYSDLGEMKLAQDYQKQSLIIRQEFGDLLGEAIALNNLGFIANAMGEREAALDYYQQSLAISKALGNKSLMASTLDNIGTVHFNLDQLDRAINSHQQALNLRQEIGDKQGEAITLNNLGATYNQQGNSSQAVSFYQQAIAIQDEIAANPTEKANTLYNLAVIEPDTETALAYVNEAIELAETTRETIASEDLKTSFFATVDDFYRLKIDIQMELHEQNPEYGYDAAAFVTSERAKARSLLDLLSKANINPTQGIPYKLASQERRLRFRLDYWEKRRVDLCREGCTPEQLNKLEQEREELLDRYSQVSSQIRATNPEYAQLTQPEPLTLAEVQKLLDEDTVLLQYSLGNQGDNPTYVWAITQDALVSYQLPSTEVITRLARRFYQQAQQPIGQETEIQDQVARKLSQTILQPVAQHLDKPRIAIAGDGILHYIPFHSLPIDDKLLIESHQLINLPSVSVLGSLRQRQQERETASKKIAIFADPIFQANDSRIKQQPQQIDNSNFALYDPNRLASSLELSLSRLPGTRREAEAILNLFDKSATSSGLDFDASKERATASELARYQIVHFATHGMLNSQRPELSGLILSLYNESGEAQNGFLRLHDVYNLDLGADLIVLSACETGLGAEVRGEGLVGLTRGFMYAGANKVLVSLWNVDDDATAFMMVRFYQLMLDDGLSPERALQQAQLEIKQQPQWQHPKYWAAFTLQGDWQ